MESIAKIKHRFYIKGQKINRIARDLNISRNTVKKVLRSNDPTKSYTRESSPAPQLGLYVEELKGLLEANAKAPPKEKYTAQRLFEVLRERGYQEPMIVFNALQKPGMEKVDPCLLKPIYRCIMRQEKLTNLTGV